jgi:class 3 adenylate cyclase
VSDFEEYRPSLGAPTAFIGTAVFDGSRVIAVMLVRFRLGPIADALSGGGQWQAEGLGRTGEVYLLGPDMTMRSDARFLIEDPKAFLESLRRSTLTSRTAETVQRLNTTVLTVPVKHEAARAALRGQTGVMELEDYRGVDVLMAYGPVDLDSLRWGLIAKIDRSEAMAPLAAYTRRALASGAALALLASVLALLMATALTRPIGALVRAARRVSEGALDVQVDVAPDDEYRELGEAFNEMVRNVRRSREDLDRQVEENERLLQSLLPASAAAQVREGTSETPHAFADVSVAHLKLAGMDAIAREAGEDRAMGLLSDVVGALDEAAEHYGVEKVSTVGASYLAASGLSLERPDHTARMVEFAREAQRIVRRFNAERQTSLLAEICINAGPVIGGLIGRRKFFYDLWGDTVRLTRRVESDGRASILVTKTVYDRVHELVPFGPPIQTNVPGIGAVELYAVLDEAVA